MAENNISSDQGARRMLGRVLGIGIIAAAAIMVVVTLVQWEIRPQTDDATVRANFVGIAPQVNGHIVELHVRDNQQVQEGDLLFLIDPRPYEIALERARATLALTRKEVDGLKNGAATAVAGVSKAAAQLDASAAEITRREMDSGAARPRDPPATSTVPACRGACEAAGAAAAAAVRHHRPRGGSAHTAGCCP